MNARPFLRSDVSKTTWAARKWLGAGVCCIFVFSEVILAQGARPTAASEVGTRGGVVPLSYHAGRLPVRP